MINTVDEMSKIDLEDFLKNKKNMSPEEFTEFLEMARASGKTAMMTVVDDPKSPETKAAKEYIMGRDSNPDYSASLLVSKTTFMGESACRAGIKWSRRPYYVKFCRIKTKEVYNEKAYVQTIHRPYYHPSHHFPLIRFTPVRQIGVRRT